jgi:DNA invertase Pin-like site-specific DNA recombinase
MDKDRQSKSEPLVKQGNFPVTEPDYDSTSNRLMVCLNAAFAQFEHYMQSERIKRGMREAAERRRTQNANQG